MIDLNDGDGILLSNSQVDSIKKHLSLVFKHEIDPSFGAPAKQDELNKIHNGIKQSLVSDGLVRC